MLPTNTRRKWYLICADLNLFLALIAFFTLQQMNLPNRVGLLTTSGFGFHLMYFFVSRIPRLQYKLMTRSPIQDLALNFLLFFSNVFIFLPLIIPVLILVIALFSGKYYLLCPMFNPLAFSFGGLSLNNYLKEQQQNQL